MKENVLQIEEKYIISTVISTSQTKTNNNNCDSYANLRNLINACCFPFDWKIHFMLFNTGNALGSFLNSEFLLLFTIDQYPQYNLSYCIETHMMGALERIS